MHALPLTLALAGRLIAASWINGPHLNHDDDGAAYRCENARGYAAVDACTALLRGFESYYFNPAAIHFARANAYLSLGEYEKAIADYDDALAPGRTGHPDDIRFTASALNNRGIAYARSGDAERAYSDFNHAITLTPDYESAYVNRASIFIARAEPERAIADYDIAIKLKPGDPDAHFMRGLAHARAGQFVEAIDDYTQTIALDTDLNATALAERCGTRAAFNKDLDKALQDCDAALKIEPRNAKALFGRGFVEFRLARFTGAIADCTASLAITAKSSSALYIRGLARLRSSDAAGMADIDAAHKIDPKVGIVFAKFGIAGGT